MADATVAAEVNRPAHWRTEKKKQKVKPVQQQEAETEAPKAGNSFANINLTLPKQEKERALKGLGSPIMMLQVPKELFQHLGRYYALLTNVKQIQDKPAINELFKKGQEFAICPMYAPDFIEASAQHGIFPMTTRAFPGNNTAFFAAKLHVNRAVTTVSKNMTLPSSSKLSGKFSVVINAYWDEVVEIIRKQHGEDWLCAPLRRVFFSMFLERKEKTRLFSIAILDNETLPQLLEIEALHQAMIQAGSPILPEISAQLALLRTKCVVAGEVGYTVGDIYTSLTGAYTVDGTGSLQLAMLGMLLLRYGYTAWDLGMSMKYKEKTLGSQEIPRNKWLDFVEGHKDLAPQSVDAKLKGPGFSAPEVGLAECAGQILPCKSICQWFKALGATAAQAA